MKTSFGLFFVRCMLMADDGANLTNGAAAVDPTASDDGREGAIVVPAPITSVETEAPVAAVIVPPVEPVVVAGEVRDVNTDAIVAPAVTPEKKKRLKAKIAAKKAPVVVKRGRGRPKGSKNKAKVAVAVKAKGKKSKAGRPKGSKNKAKVEVVAKAGSGGRPRQYTGAVETYIASLIKKHGQTNTRKILTDRVNGKFGKLRDVEKVPEKLTISLPTLIRITKEHNITVPKGRPRIEAA